MEFEQMQIAAGVVSSLMFVSGNFPMLFKAAKTKDMGSYSLGNIGMSNLGNLIHWLYISSLPFGPVWFLHGFFTITTALMLVWYLRYEKGWNYPTLTLYSKMLWDRRKENKKEQTSCQSQLWNTDLSSCKS